MTWLKGKKTYVIAVLMILVGVVNGLTGDAGVAGFDWGGIWSNAQIILGGFGLGALRAGVSKVIL